MLVETYEIEETQSEAATLAADSESIELIERLNLIGQLGLTDTKTATRFPYRKMTKREADVYGVLCPRRARLESYSDGIIPVRVLQVAAHANETGFLKSMEVWFPENADIKDPVLVGMREAKNEHGWNDTERYILARWGEVLEDLSTLAIEATKLVRSKLKAKLQSVRREVEFDLAALEGDEIPLDKDITYYGLGR